MSVGPHNTLIQSAAPVTVVVGEDGRWFRVLRWIVASGVWANLSNDGRAVLVSMHFHAQGEDRVVNATVQQIQSSAGSSRSRTYAAIRELIEHPARLLAVQGAGWALLPGRIFAGRSVPRAGQMSHGRDDPVPRAGHLSHGRDDSAPASQGTCARSERPVREDSRQTDSAAVVKALEAEGFGQRDIADYLRRGATLDAVETAKRNADHLRRQGKLRDRRKLIGSLLTRTSPPTLFDGVEEAESKVWRNRILDIVQQRVPTRDHDRAAAWLLSEIRHGRLTPAMTAGLTAEQVFALICAPNPRRQHDD